MKSGDEARPSVPARTDSTEAVATVVTLTPSSLQQQSAVQQYVITGALPIVQATSITQSQLQQARPQLFAQVQGIQPIAPQVQTSYQLSADVAKPSASAVVVSSVPTAVQLQSPALTNTLQRHLTSQGVLSLPTLSPGRAYTQSGSSLIHHVAGTASTLSLQPAIQKSPVASSPQLHHQPQDAAQHPLASVSGSSSVSASGGTIHHHGHSPSRGALPPLANPQQLLTMNINLSSSQSSFSSPQQQQQAQVQQRRLSGSGGGGGSRNLHDNRTSPVAAVLGSSSGCGGGGATFILQSPQASPDRPRKRIKLEEMPPASTQAANYRKLILDHKHREMLEIKETYHEHLTELFFLQNGGNIMDYFQWKKRPTVQLVQFLKSGNLDSDDEDEVHGHEKRINDEVKIITSSGSNTPLATPVAISTTLPAAVASLQHQQQAGDHSRKLGGRHGMIFGHLHPGSTVPAAQTSQAQHAAASHAASSSSSVPTSTAAASAAGVTSTVQHTPQTITITATLPYPSLLTTSSIATPTSTTKSTRTVMTASTTPTISSDRYTSTIKSPPVVVKKEMPESALTISQVLRQSTTTASSLNASLGNSVTKSPKTSTSPNKPHSRQHSISAVYEHTLGSQEAIVERAKQEAQVMQRIADLRKEGLWSSRRLPKVQEPVRNKAHWDYLLEEMQWLAADFAQERKWKKAASRKIARMIMRYFQEQQQKEQRAEKEEGMRTKRIASNLAKQVKEFWLNIEKVVQYKQQSRLEEKRKKALDVHLNFIVDQTEKYSSWLSEGLTANSTVSSHTGSKNTSPSHSIADVDFEPEREESTDDEETIEREEETYGVDKEGEKAEVEALKKESEVPIEDLLKSLPPEVLSNEEPPEKAVSKEDEEFMVSSNDEDAADEEETLAEQEKHEKADGYDEEMDDLKAENEMSVEELMKKYSGAYDSDFEMPESESEVSSSEEEESDDAESDDAESNEELSEGSDAEAENEDLENVGMEYLINPEAEQPEPDEKESTGPKKEITDIAAAAMSIQPTGYTFDTTQVKTPVPFLLKHKLREYQHVGMEWLATMHERKLNGILADEMGLGKTIQTIAMLGNLACQHGTWGPHLIVVPTSVMLNWEMELKKWCPAFKILTYYGNQKERKMKRQGWTKTNAFHVCITSYKLVIQDHQSFRRKKWKYLILDEAQNIKNFKSQRWQTLLNFSSQRRLLLTGTPLQNSLMELWSLMHFLMPHVFQSHREFKEWFSNPLSGMIEGSHEYNESLVKRLHKVLRPFLLRRLKVDVEKQMPQKYEHVVMCRLSKRQRYLYDDFMSQTKTKETLQTGHFMSVINILMQLRKVCNHPNLFDPRPIVSPFQMEGITFSTASLVIKVLEFDPLKNVDFFSMYSCLGDLELTLPAFAAHRIKKLQTPRKLIVEIDSQPEPTPRLKPLVKPKPLVFRSMSPMTQVCKVSGRASPFSPIQPSTLSSPIVARSTALTVTSQPLSRASPVMTQAGGPLKSLVSAVPTVVTSATDATALKSPVPQPAKEVASVVSSAVSSTITPSSSGNLSHVLTSQPITVQIHHTQQGTRLMIPSDQLSNLPGFIHIVQTSNVQSAVSSSQQQTSADLSSQAVVVNGPAVSAVSSPLSRPVTTVPAGTVLTQSLISAKHSPAIQLPSTNATNGKPVVRVSPLSSAPPTSTSFITLTSADQTKVAGKTVSLQPTSSVLKPSAGTTSKPVATTTLVSATPSATTATRVLSQTANAKKLKEKSPFYLKELEEKRCQRRTHKLERIASINKRRSEVKPVYGQDFCHAVNIFCDSPYNNRTNSYAKPPEESSWHGQGFLHCHNVHNAKRPNHPNHYWTQTDALSRIVHTPEMCLEELDSIINRYVFVTPTVCAPRIRMHTCHPSPSQAFAERKREFLLHQELAPKLTCLHKICSNMHVQFPELRLIQYDCGKLQTMDLLLRKLKNGGHRVLIFTQMTKMLDVLEAFLNYHGHRYLRLDGTTNVEKRQALMERFNMDRRIFCFILSTRSGGIGVNLTGADTVIFYDSDWNPTMDAQAQDRCHRIGQTRDVHIYRLISDKTIEENILKKANQKRLLGDVAIEGGNFTTAFFKQNTINELFDEPSGLDALAKEKASREIKMAAQRKAEQAESHLTTEQMEQALCNAEDETDVQAAKVVHAEQKAELAEFDEEIPWDERESSEQKERQDEEVSRVEMELAMLDKELTPVERYAVLYMEKQMEPLSDELEKAEEEVAMAKEEWELGRLKIMKEEEERRAELEEDEMLFTYSRDDAYNQMYICDENSEYMPMWAPPTPPQDDNDIYIDQTICFLFEPSVMPESQLPPVFVKKEHKRVRVDPNSGRKQKVRKDDQIRVPRSLFDRPTAALQKMRREAKLQRLKQGFKPTIKSLPSLSSSKPMLETPGDHPEWLIHEDWALLQAVQFLQELPLNLMIVNPAHIPNWDMVSDIVNVSSRLYRSSRQCKNRYETVIVPREEGKILYDINPRKQKKSKGIYKTKNNRPMRTSQLYIQDNYLSLTTLHNHRFDTVKAASAKRTPTLKSTLANPTHKNPKHAAVLASYGITNYDQPSTPIQVATIRAERIAREKKTQAVNAAAAEQLQQAQRAQQQQQQAQAQAQGTATSAQPTATLVQAQQLQPVATVPNTATLQPSAIQKTGVATGITAVSLARTLGTNIVVNTPAGTVQASPFATINKRVASLAQTTTVSALTGTLTQAVRARTASGMMVHDLSAAIAGQPQARAASHATTSTLLTTAALTPTQLVAAQRVGAVTAITTVASGTTTVQQQLAAKNLTPQQLAYIRQQALNRQKQRTTTYTPAQAEQLRKLQQQAAAQGVTVTSLQKNLGVTTPLTITQTSVTQAPRLQVSVAKSAGLKQMTRPATEAEMALLFRRQQQQQQKASGQTSTQTVHQIQLTPQLFAQAQIPGQAGTQPVATLVKTVPTPVSIPSVTIPVTVGGVNINVSVPQQKATTVPKATAVNPQLRTIQQLQQRKVTAAQLQQQKVTTLTAAQIQQVAAASGTQLQTPLIIQQQQKQVPTAMTVQQIRQIVKQQQQQQQAQSGRTPSQTIQQIITSVTPPVSTATIIASQLFSQSQATPSIPTVSKLSLPVTALVTPARTVTPVAVNASPSVTVSAITTTPTVTVTTIPAMTASPSTTLTLGAGSKSLEQVVVSPAKMVTQGGAVVQQVKTFQTAQIQGSSQVTQVQVQTTPHLQLQTTPTGVTQVHLTPHQVQVHKPATIAQAINQVQQQATVTTPVTVTQVQQQQATTQQPQATAQPQQAAATLQVSQQSVQQIQVTSDPQNAQSKASPYTMRLRNSRS